MAELVYTTHNATDVLERFLKEIGIRENFKIASDFMLTRETHTAIQDVQKKIKRIGLKNAFRLAGLQILFSGPLRQIKDDLCKPFKIDDNTKRAKEYPARCFKGESEGAGVALI